jgi:excisionase family DNA binding protein
MEKKEFYSIPELAKLMNISRIAVYKKVKKGQIKAKKAGRDYVIPSSEADEFIVSDEEPAAYGKIETFKPGNGPFEIEVKLQNDNVWLNASQMSALFGRDKKVIFKHINNVINDGELSRDSVVANFATTASDGKIYDVAHYNLDMIISVGYRVKSAAGVQFRIWATNVLKQHIIKGYSINERRLKETSKALDELRSTISILARSVNDENFKGLEAELINVINGFAGSLNILQNYDDMKLKAGGKKKQEYELTYEEALIQIDKAKQEYIKHKKASGLFGKGKGDKLKSLLGAVNQSFSGKDVYPTAEEKAAHLLYFAVKDHPFADGNKRIAAILFLYYLAKNNLLYKSDGSASISNGAVASLTLLTAISAPAEKDTIVKVILNVMRAG